MPLLPIVARRRRATTDVQTVRREVLDGVEFLSLPPLRYCRGEAKPSIRAVLGSKRLVSFKISYACYWSIYEAMPDKLCSFGLSESEPPKNVLRTENRI